MFLRHSGARDTPKPVTFRVGSGGACLCSFPTFIRGCCSHSWPWLGRLLRPGAGYSAVT